MSKEPTKADLWWIVEEVVRQVENAAKPFTVRHCVICGEFFWGKHAQDCVYDAAKLALEGRRSHVEENAQ